MIPLTCLAAVKGPAAAALRVQRVSLARAQDAALAKVEIAGICGSDLRVYRNDRPAVPGIIGHECVASVVETGAGDASLPPGTLFTLNPNNPRDKDDIIGYNGRGIFSEYITIDHSLMHSQPGRIFPLDQCLSAEQAVFVEPLACVVHSLGKIKGEIKGKNAVVAGAGVFGLLHVMLLRHYQAAKVLLINRSRERIDLAVQRGIINGPDAFLSGDGLPGQLRGATAGRGPEIAIIASSPADLPPALDYLASQGRIGVFSATRPGSLLALETGEMDVHRLRREEQSATIAWRRKRITLSGSYGATDADFREAIKLLAAGAIEPRGLITHRVSLPALPEVMRRLSERNILLGQTAGKVLIDMALKGMTILKTPA
jgi:threonine dehydrogenase-like Zn-dependent dehydrogenase